MRSRTRYHMRHQWKTTGRMGQIIPIFMQPTCPGDTWSGRSMHIARMAALNKPVFANFQFETYWFHVPTRMVWNKDLGDTDNFTEAITEKDASVAFPSATISKQKSEGTANLISHYLGCGFHGAAETDFSVNALPIRAYNLIVKTFFLPDPLAEIFSITSQTEIYNACYEKVDYLMRSQTDTEQGSTVTIDTSGSTLNIEDVTDAIKRQRQKKRREMYGEDYADMLRGMGLKVPESALKRPERCAMSRMNMGISEVVATATSASENTGEYRGHGIGVGRVGFKPRMFLEHGYLMGVAVMRPKYTSKNFIDRHMLFGNGTAGLTVNDFWQPDLEGSQMVNVFQIEADSQVAAASRFTTWAYSHQYEEYRTARDITAGEFLVDTFDTQNSFVEYGGTLPAYLVAQQIEDTDFDYLFQDSTEPHYFCYNDHAVGKKSLVRRAQL